MFSFFFRVKWMLPLSSGPFRTRNSISHYLYWLVLKVQNYHNHYCLGLILSLSLSCWRVFWTRDEVAASEAVKHDVSFASQQCFSCVSSCDTPPPSLLLQHPCKRWQQLLVSSECLGHSSVATGYRCEGCLQLLAGISRVAQAKVANNLLSPKVPVYPPLSYPSYPLLPPSSRPPLLSFPLSKIVPVFTQPKSPLLLSHSKSLSPYTWYCKSPLYPLLSPESLFFSP